MKPSSTTLEQEQVHSGAATVAALLLHGLLEGRMLYMGDQTQHFRTVLTWVSLPQSNLRQ